MARRRKHSTALFEVMNASLRKPRAPSALPRVRRGWWFGRPSRPAVPHSPPPPLKTDPDDPTANVTAAMLVAQRPPVVMAPPPALPAPPPAPASLPVVPAQVEPPVESTPAAAPASTAVTALAKAPAAAPVLSRSGMHLTVDRDRQEVTLKMRYTSAVISAFTLLVVVGLAYVIGRRMAEGPLRAHATDAAPANAPTKQAPPQPSVLNTPAKPPKAAPPRPADLFAGGPRTGAAAGTAVQASASRPAIASPAYVDAKMVGGVARRTIGLNYLLITSYPPEMKPTAYEVANFLIANGVGCTVEQGSARTQTHTGWYCVIGTRGFPPGFSRLPEYDKYLKDLSTAARKFPSKSKFDKVQPLAFKWME